MAKKETAYDRHERAIIEGADCFVACDFRGGGTYARAESKTLKQAIKDGEGLIKARAQPSGRPCLVYAVAGTHQVVAATIKPDGPDRYRVLPSTGARSYFDVVDEGTGGANEILCSTTQGNAKRIAKALNETAG